MTKKEMIYCSWCDSKNVIPLRHKIIDYEGKPYVRKCLDCGGLD